jgi:hypothetical protein
VGSIVMREGSLMVSGRCILSLHRMISASRDVTIRSDRSMKLVVLI